MNLLAAGLALAGLWVAALHVIDAPYIAWIAVCLVGAWAVLGSLDP